MPTIKDDAFSVILRMRQLQPWQQADIIRHFLYELLPREPEKTPEERKQEIIAEIGSEFDPAEKEAIAKYLASKEK